MNYCQFIVHRITPEKNKVINHSQKEPQRTHLFDKLKITEWLYGIAQPIQLLLYSVPTNPPPRTLPYIVVGHCLKNKSISLFQTH